MKILLTTNKFFINDGGSYTAVSELSYALNKKNNLTAKILHNNNNNNIFNISFYKILVKKFDIIHIFGIWSPFLILVFYYAKKFKKKIIISPIGFLESWSLLQSRIKKFLAWYIYQKKILENVDFIHVTSIQEFNSIKKLNLNNKNVFILPHGNLDKYYSDLINNHHKNKKIRKFLFFSRIHKKKGLLELIEAWKISKPNNWVLEICGPVSDINYENIVRKKINLYNLDNQIFFSYPIFDKYSKQLKLLDSDVVILPSKNENFAFSVCEAMSLGLVVLTSSETPWKEINQLKAGFCSKLDQVDDIVIALKKIYNLKDQDFYRIGKKAKEYIKMKFDLENVIIYKYINFYKSILDKS